VRLLRSIRTAGVGMLLAAGVGSAVLYYLLRRSVPRTRGRLRLKGLHSQVEIIRDRWGVPHIYASNRPDLMFAFGFIQAQDRFWQMELHRLLGMGSLAEVLGEAALEIDRLSRHVGFRRAAQRDWEQAKEVEREVLEAFSAGINSYLASSSLPIEFKILRYRPKLWQPVESLAFAKFLAWTLNGNWDYEVLRSWTVERFGPELAAELEPNYPPGQPLIVPAGAEAHGANPPLEEEFAKVQDLILATGRAMSNCWAVSGAKSVTGKPILANDPHLPLQMPSLWYEAHLDSPELKVAGACLPGFPSILIGHNQDIAWGLTAALADGDDLFVERVDPDDPHRYEFQGQWLEADVVQEEIKVRGRKGPAREEIVITRHGPIISPCIRGETRPLALKTTILEPAHPIEIVLMLMSATNWGEFREALRGWPAPPQSFSYADVKGNIGYQLAGLIPMRARGYGMVPSPGWTDEYEWTGFIPFDELPSSSNPETQWSASANNKIVDDDYPYFLTFNYANGYRQQRIVQLLGSKEKFSLDDFKAMQADLYSIPGRELARYIISLPAGEEWVRRAQTFVKAWDYLLSPNSVAACIVEVFFSHLVRKALQEKLGSWSEFYLGRGIHRLRDEGHFFGDSASWILDKITSRPQWFAEKSWQEAMAEALASAMAELRTLLGDDVSRWQWGRLHSQRFHHVLGRGPALARLFNRGPVPVGGDANTLWQAAYYPRHQYQCDSYNASYRQIIDLSDFNKSLAVIPSGQSGQPSARHYADQISLWQRGEYHPMPWDRADVEAVAEARFILEPGGDGTGV